MNNYNYMKKHNPEALYTELTNEYSTSAREYFMVLKLAIYHIDRENIDSSFKAVQYEKSKEVWALACDIMRTLYEKREED